MSKVGGQNLEPLQRCCGELGNQMTPRFLMWLWTEEETITNHLRRCGSHTLAYNRKGVSTFAQLLGLWGTQEF